jgi:hypothetical protein
VYTVAVDKTKLVIGIFLDGLVAVFWLFPDILFSGAWGESALTHPILMAFASFPFIVLSLVFYIAAFRPRKRGRERVSPSMWTFLGSILFSSPFFGLDLVLGTTALNPLFVLVGSALIVWGSIPLLRLSAS